MKICTKCKLEKDTSEFGEYKNGKDGLRAECKECHRERNALHYKENKDRRRELSRLWSNNNKEAVRFYYVKRMYGITKQEWEALLLKQDNKCAICGDTSEDKGFFCTDHDHKTGKVRGLLCKHCNTVLGHAKDNISILENAIKYLNKNVENG